MSRAPRWALAIILIPIIAALATAAVMRLTGRHEVRQAASPSNRPTLLLLTGLPLLFNDEFLLTGHGSPVLKALQRKYRVVPISVPDASELAKSRLLLMAQPQAQSPENLVTLDQWVRGGGRVLLLADPMLEWPSKLPLGDPARPPPMFVDTGLLAHWGLRLDAPDQRGPARREIDGISVLTVSPGSLYGNCQTSEDRAVARCKIGKGEATIIADADWLNVDELGTGASRNLDGLLAELARLGQS